MDRWLRWRRRQREREAHRAAREQAERRLAREQGALAVILLDRAPDEDERQR